MAPKAAAKRGPSNGPTAKAAPAKAAGTAGNRTASAEKTPTKAAGKAKASAAPAQAGSAAAAEEESFIAAVCGGSETAPSAPPPVASPACGQDEAEAAKRKEAMEAELQRLAALANGEVIIKYSMYAEKFKITDHKLKAKDIDELYCLSDVMPGCFIHLAEKEFGHSEYAAGLDVQPYVKEDPPGTFVGLMADETYWCYVQQDPEQEKKDQDALKKRWAGVKVGGGLGDRGSEAETCSCGWGAPCTNAMVCKDYDNRFANAIKAGGNPILFTG